MTGPVDVCNLDAFGELDSIDHDVHAPGHPEQLIGLTITLAGNSHPQHQEFIEKEFRRLKAESEAEAMAKEAGKPVPKKDMTIAELRVENVRSLAARILRANKPIKFHGAQIELTPETALQILADPKFNWLIPQLVEKVQNTENFMPAFGQS